MFPVYYTLWNDQWISSSCCGQQPGCIDGCIQLLVINCAIINSPPPAHAPAAAPLIRLLPLLDHRLRILIIIYIQVSSETIHSIVQ